MMVSALRSVEGMVRENERLDNGQLSRLFTRSVVEGVALTGIVGGACQLYLGFREELSMENAPVFNFVSDCASKWMSMLFVVGGYKLMREQIDDWMEYVELMVSLIGRYPTTFLNLIIFLGYNYYKGE